MTVEATEEQVNYAYEVLNRIKEAMDKAMAKEAAATVGEVGYRE